MTQSNHALILTFDPACEARIESIWHQLADLNISRAMLDYKVRPHISLGVFRGPPPDNLPAVLETCAKTAPFEIVFSSIGIFPGQEGVIFLAPKMTEPLLNAHRQFFEALKGQQHLCDPLYDDKNWIPHCTLAHPIDHKMKARAVSEVAELAGNWQPISGSVTGIELISFHPVTRLAGLPLSGTT